MEVTNLQMIFLLNPVIFNIIFHVQSTAVHIQRQRRAIEGVQTEGLLGHLPRHTEVSKLDDTCFFKASGHKLRFKPINSNFVSFFGKFMNMSCWNGKCVCHRKPSQKKIEPSIQRLRFFVCVIVFTKSELKGPTPSKFERFLCRLSENSGGLSEQRGNNWKAAVRKIVWLSWCLWTLSLGEYAGWKLITGCMLPIPLWFGTFYNRGSFELVLVGSLQTDCWGCSMRLSCAFIGQEKVHGLDILRAAQDSSLEVKHILSCIRPFSKHIVVVFIFASANVIWKYYGNK